MVEEKCLCEVTETLIFPCSGGSNVGQISNQVAMDLAMRDKGKMYCLAGIGGHVDALIESTKCAKKIIAIDGCPVHCAKKTLEHAGFNVDIHETVTNLGIEKKPNFLMELDEIEEVINSICSKM